MKDIRKFARYLRPYRGALFVFALLSIVSVVFSLFSLTMAIPFLQVLFGMVEPAAQAPEAGTDLSSLIDRLYYYISQTMAGSDKISLLAAICGIVTVSFFIKNASTYLSLHILAPMRSGVIYSLRKRLYSKIQDLPLSYFNDQRKGDILTRMSADVVEVEWGIMNSIVSALRDPFVIIAFLSYMFYMSYELTLFALVLLPISAFIIGRISRSLRKSSSKSQHTLTEIMVLLEETLSGVRIIKAFQARNSVEKSFESYNHTYFSLGKSIFRKRSLSSPLSEFLGSLVVVSVMWFGGNIVLRGDMDAAMFITYIALFSQVITPAKSVAATFYNFKKGIASLDRIEEILEQPVDLNENAGGIKPEGFQNKIELREVEFAYNSSSQQVVLDRINLEIPKGKTVALVGPSGSGKSTLADLVCRFYDPLAGEILLDGKNIRDFDSHAYRSLLGIVPQTPLLFHDTIASNIAFGHEFIDEDRLIHAAKQAHAHDFITQFEKGYDTLVGDAGVKLSGGQRQRIAIARALYKNPEILILDEATSALDTESEKLVQDAINSLVKNRTVLVIAHRLSTIRQADYIYVLNDGRMVEQGQHDALIRQDGLYARLFQLSAVQSD